MHVEPSGQSHGARVTGVDLSQPLDPTTVAEIREAWLRHAVLAFPDQSLSDTDLERFTTYFGPFGHDPFIQPIDGHAHVIAVQRRAEEKASIFADAWHTDWSFQAHPPAGTCLYGLIIPPEGGDTLFAHQQLALAAMPAALRERIEGRLARHSARIAYSPNGLYGEADRKSDRSMRIVPSPEAQEEQLHPLIRPHPETGVEGVFGCLGYVIGIDGMSDGDAWILLSELLAWQTREEFQYRHRWAPQSLVMWDNRTVLHRATGGYEGHDRLLHRTTIGASQ